MAPMMMMELKLAAIAFGLAQAATKVCVDDNQFDGTAKVTHPQAQGATCAQYQTFLPTFTASKAKCSGDITISTSVVRAASVFEMLGVCCKSGGDVCKQYTINPCATAGDYKPTHEYESGKKCSVMAALAPSMTPSSTSCAVIATMPDKTKLSLFAMTGYMADKGCCGTGKSACDQFKSNPNPSSNVTTKTSTSDASSVMCTGWMHMLMVVSAMVAMVR